MARHHRLVELFGVATADLQQVLQLRKMRVDRGQEPTIDDIRLPEIGKAQVLLPSLVG